MLNITFDYYNDMKKFLEIIYSNDVVDYNVRINGEYLDKKNSELFVSIGKELVKILDDYRLRHSVAVMVTAMYLSKIHKLDTIKTGIASLLHDCGKLQNELVILELKKNNIYISEFEERNPHILHGKLGVFYAQKIFKIDDIDILNSIRYHTTGRCNMSKLEKIVFISDFIEFTRPFDSDFSLEFDCMINLDLAMYLILKKTLKSLLKKDREISLQSLSAYIYYKQKCMKNINWEGNIKE